MGLDSVDLLVAIENYFGIQIPDTEAQEIFTVQNMVDVVAKHLHLSDDSMSNGEITDQFKTVQYAANFQTLIDKNNIKSKYEVYVIIMGITVAQTGVDYYDITPDKSFTSDLGID
ncbi:hypothetical protein MRBLMN1_003840 [Chitinophaga ginsengisegetis]|uniref:hypothetical protein n=1 Tax=Chitinophaga ginsengisegetis TaxID=393003 RepID=UPI003416CF8E